jgi:choline dehydrogenase-like flavoprotein
LFDFIVIGSGPAGTWSSKKLSERGFKVAVLDIGDLPPNVSYPKKNFYELKKQGLNHKHFIGDNYEALENVWNDFLSPKLKSPLMRFITRHSKEFKLNDDFHGLSSSARGGLANAWGGHLYRFNEDELQEFPFNYSEIKPFYDEISKEVGISGSEDDLLSFLLEEPNLLPCLNLDNLSKYAYNKYRLKRKSLNKSSLYLGSPRIAISTKPHNDRRKYNYQNLEFFYPTQETLYSPRFTINKLIKNKEIQYFDSSKVTYFKEDKESVTVYIENVKDRTKSKLEGKKVFIACGVLNSTRLVLRSLKLFEKKLPFLDNQVSYIPLINPFFIGKEQERFTYNAQLNLIFKGIYGTFYNLNSILRNDSLFEIPLNFKNLLWASKNLFQSMHILQLWYTGEKLSQNTISLSPNDVLNVNYTSDIKGQIEPLLIKLLFKIGYISHKTLVKYLEPGSSYHYAGTMPMTGTGSPINTNDLGKLKNLDRVHVIDSSIFPSLPSKNLSFTIMANAARIASKVNI